MGNARAIDLFAGAGGFTEGATRAGVDVVWAANHWPDAVEIHRANHPSADHVCQDLQQADWSQVPEHDLLLASPSCTGFTRARGKERPSHEQARSTAWAVVSCAEYHRPPVVVVENVPEFKNWILFDAWAAALKALGYALTLREADAADAGVPQHRVRLFVIATRTAAPFDLQLPKVDHVPASSVIDFDLGPWSDIEKPGRATATLERIARGRARYGDRFVMPYYSGGSGLTGRSLDRPLGTVTTRGRWGLVDGSRMRMLQPSELCGAMGFPTDYKLPTSKVKAIHMLGNAVCPPVVEQIVRAVAS